MLIRKFKICIKKITLGKTNLLNIKLFNKILTDFILESMQTNIRKNIPMDLEWKLICTFFLV